MSAQIIDFLQKKREKEENHRVLTPEELQALMPRINQFIANNAEEITPLGDGYLNVTIQGQELTVKVIENNVSTNN